MNKAGFEWAKYCNVRWQRVLLKKLRFARLRTIFPTLMILEILLLCSEELRINIYSEPNKSIHVHPHTIFLLDAIGYCAINMLAPSKRSPPFKISSQNLHGFLNSATRNKPTCPHHVMLSFDHPVKIWQNYELWHSIVYKFLLLLLTNSQIQRFSLSCSKTSQKQR